MYLIFVLFLITLPSYLSDAVHCGTVRKWFTGNKCCGLENEEEKLLPHLYNEGYGNVIIDTLNEYFEECREHHIHCAVLREALYQKHAHPTDAIARNWDTDADGEPDLFLGDITNNTFLHNANETTLTNGTKEIFTKVSTNNVCTLWKEIDDELVLCVIAGNTTNGHYLRVDLLKRKPDTRRLLSGRSSRVESSTDEIPHRRRRRLCFLWILGDDCDSDDRDFYNIASSTGAATVCAHGACNDKQSDAAAANLMNAASVYSQDALSEVTATPKVFWAQIEGPLLTSINTCFDYWELTGTVTDLANAVKMDSFNHAALNSEILALYPGDPPKEVASNITLSNQYLQTQPGCTEVTADGTVRNLWCTGTDTECNFNCTAAGILYDKNNAMNSVWDAHVKDYSCAKAIANLEESKCEHFLKIHLNAINVKCMEAQIIFGLGTFALNKLLQAGLVETGYSEMTMAIQKIPVLCKASTNLLTGMGINYVWNKIQNAIGSGISDLVNMFKNSLKATFNEVSAGQDNINTEDIIHTSTQVLNTTLTVADELLELAYRAALAFRDFACGSIASALMEFIKPIIMCHIGCKTNRCVFGPGPWINKAPAKRNLVDKASLCNCGDYEMSGATANSRWITEKFNFREEPYFKQNCGPTFSPTSSPSHAPTCIMQGSDWHVQVNTGTDTGCLMEDDDWHVQVNEYTDEDLSQIDIFSHSCGEPSHKIRFSSSDGTTLNGECPDEGDCWSGSACRGKPGTCWEQKTFSSYQNSEVIDSYSCDKDETFLTQHGEILDGECVTDTDKCVLEATCQNCWGGTACKGKNGTCWEGESFSSYNDNTPVVVVHG